MALLRLPSVIQVLREPRVPQPGSASYRDILAEAKSPWESSLAITRFRIQVNGKDVKFGIYHDGRMCGT